MHHKFVFSPNSWVMGWSWLASDMSNSITHPFPTSRIPMHGMYGGYRQGGRTHKLDASMGFWQIPLADESAKLTTFITLFGHYYFNCSPFGIASAPTHFQNCMVTEVAEGLDGVIIFILCYRISRMQALALTWRSVSSQTVLKFRAYHLRCGCTARPHFTSSHLIECFRRRLISYSYQICHVPGKSLSDKCQTLCTCATAGRQRKHQWSSIWTVSWRICQRVHLI